MKIWSHTSSILWNLGLRGGVSNLSDVNMSKEVEAIEDELGGPIVLETSWKLLPDYRGLDGTRNW